MERRGVLPITQFAYRKGLGTYDAGTLKTALESGLRGLLLGQPSTNSL